jgi:lysophospholipase L1-like esterase
MARHRFGGSPSDIAMQRVGDQMEIRGGAIGTVWDAVSGGNLLDDLTDLAGAPITQVIADDNGGVSFYGPDGVAACYIDFGYGRYLMQAMDLGTDIETLRSDVTADIDSLTTLVGEALPESTVDAKGDLLAGTAADTVARLPAGGDGQLLVANSLEATGLRWGAAWRRRDLPDPVIADSVISSAPTIGVTQQSTSTIASAQALLPPDTGPFLYLGAGSFQFGASFPDTTLYLPTSRYPNTYNSGQSNWSVEFMTDASVFEIMFKYISSATRYRLTVDGRKVTDLAQTTGASSAGSRHVLKVDFGSAAPRRIRFDFTTMPFGGLYLGPGATAWKPTSRGGRLGILGDSISDGSSENTGSGIGTWFYRAARLLGCTDAWDQARGGTGYITAGSFATLANRVAGDISPYSFDRLIVWAGYNDNAGDQPTIQAAAEALYATLKEEITPGGEIYVIGCWSPSGSPAASITNTDNSLKAAAAAADLPFISPLSGSVYDAGGNLLATQGAWITTANASGYIGSDNVHPNDNGHIYLARRVVEALKALMPA